MPFPYEEFDLSGVRTYPLKSRASKAKAADFGRPCAPGGTLGELLASFPNMLAAADFRAVVRAIVEARRHDSGIVWGLGAHVIKTGLGPIVIDLMERGFVSAVATNGAAIIHDFEVALARNRGVAFSGLTTVNMDFIRHYRPQTNVVARPTASSGRGYSLLGHHEIMIPLLAAAVIDADRSREEKCYTRSANS